MLKVLVHLNHGTDRTYLLEMKKCVTVRDVRGILAEDRLAIPRLIAKSKRMTGLAGARARKVSLKADFIVSDFYSVQKLA